MSHFPSCCYFVQQYLHNNNNNTLQKSSYNEGLIWVTSAGCEDIKFFWDLCEACVCKHGLECSVRWEFPLI